MTTTIAVYDMNARTSLSVEELEDDVAFDRFVELQKKFQGRLEVDVKVFTGLGKKEVMKTFPWLAVSSEGTDASLAAGTASGS